MHELSIVENIIEIAEENAKKLKAHKVQEIEIDIGEMSGVDYDAMEFALQHFPKTEMFKNVHFIINKIPAIALCNNCKKEFLINDFFDVCPQCGSFENEIIQGKELKVKTIKID